MRKRVGIAVGILILVCVGIVCGTFFWNTEDDIMTLYRQTVADSSYIMHALGGLEGEYSYTNSLEALEKSYYEDDMRLFEADVHFTSDDVLVLTHGWKEKDYEQRMGLDYALYDGAMSYDEFCAAKLHGKFTTMSFQDLAEFMEAHTDMFVMVDSGNISYDDTKLVYEAIVADVNEVCEDADNVLQRLIVGGHTQDMIQAVREAYDFQLVNLYLAEESKRAEGLQTLDEFFAYCTENDIVSFSADKGTITDEVVAYAREAGMIIYAFTVNDLSELTFDYTGEDIVIGTDFLR